MQQIKNPYCFRCGDVIVKISFANTGCKSFIKFGLSDVDWTKGDGSITRPDTKNIPILSALRRKQIKAAVRSQIDMVIELERIMEIAIGFPK